MTLPAVQPLLNIYDVMPAAFREALSDPYVTDLAVRDNGHGYITRRGNIEDIGPAAEYVPLMLHLAAPAEMGRLINDENISLECRLPNGERLIGNRPEVSGNWTTTIRRHFQKRLTWQDQIDMGTVTEPAANWIEEKINSGCSGVIAGGMGSGKTTLLNTMLGGTAFDTLITVKIEKVIEIMGPRICTSYEIGELMSFAMARHKALRESAEVFIVGEATTGPDMAEVMATLETGHQSFTTLHADDVAGIPTRIEGMLRMANDNRNQEQIHAAIVQHVDFCVHMQKCADGKRVVTDVAALAMSGGRATRREVAL